VTVGVGEAPAAVNHVVKKACGGHTHVGTRQRAVGLWEC
jgi:hypothetical protein